MADPKPGEPSPEAPAPARSRHGKPELTVAVIGAGGVVLAAVVSGIFVLSGSDEQAPRQAVTLRTSTAEPASSRAPLPRPDCASCREGISYPERAGTGEPNTYRDPRTLTGVGPELRPLQRVSVLCKFYAPSVASVGDYWYLVLDHPWNGNYYSPSNSFLNGDTPDGHGDTAVDRRVPDC